MVVDREGHVVRHNRSAARLFGDTALSPGVDLIAVLAGEDELPAHAEVFDRVAKGQPWTGVLEVRGATGMRLEAEVDCVPVLREGAPVGLLWLFAAAGTTQAEERLGRLTRVTAALAAASDLDDVTAVMTRHAADALGAIVSSLALREGDHLVLLGLEGGVSGSPEHWQRWAVNDATPAGDVVSSGEPLLLTGRDAIRERYPALEHTAVGERTLLVLPLRVAGEVTGVFTLSFPGRRVLDPLENEYLNLLVDAGAQAAARIRAQEDRAEQAARSRFLADVSAQLADSLDYGSTLRTVARMAVPEFADWSAIDIVEDERLHRIAVEHVDPKRLHLARDIEERYPSDRDSGSGPWAVVRSGESFLIEEVSDEMLVEAARDETHLALARSLELTSMLLVPLLARGRLLGVFTLATAESRRRLTSSDVKFAEDLARRAAVAIDNAQLHSQTLRMAAELQQAVFPPLPTDVPGWSITGHYRPSGRTDVGGDFYDVCPLSDGRVAFFVGDVMGRGVAAAAAMAQVRSALRAYLAIDPAPDRVLTHMDGYFTTHHLDQLVTLTYGVASADRSTLQLANAGHPPSVALRVDGVQLLHAADDPPIGMGQHRTVRTVSLAPGDGVLLYTDGLIERRDEDIDDGIARLVAALRQGPGLAEERLEDLVDDIRDPTRDDDVAALVLRRLPDAAARPA